MALTKSSREEIIKKFQLTPNDTASPQVQIAMLTSRLTYLNDHFKENKKDHHSRRGLMKMVGRRRRLLTYLRSRDLVGYQKLITSLGIRK